MNNCDGSFDGGCTVFLPLITDSEKAIFGFLEEIFNNNKDSLMASVVISIEVLFDVHVEYITRKKYLTETRFGNKKESLITILNDQRWESFEYSHKIKNDVIVLHFSEYSFTLLNQIVVLGNYRNCSDVLLVVMRLLCVLALQSVRHIPVNSFYKIYDTQIYARENSINFYYEDVTQEIKGLVKSH